MKPSSVYVYGEEDEKKLTLIHPGVGPELISVEHLKKKIAYDSKYQVMSQGKAWIKRYATIPCGKCELCRRRNSSQWAIRAELETIERGEPIFVTLTYSDFYLPEDKKVHPDHFQRFIKALRDFSGQKMTYMACGEYGERFGRPHFHAVIWGYRPKDLRILWNNGRYNTYDSKTINRIWGKGFTTIGIGDAGATARYVASYVKKNAAWFTASKRPAIGKTYFDNHILEPNEKLYLAGHEKPVFQPRYFLKKQKELHPEEMKAVAEFMTATQNNMRSLKMSLRDNEDLDDSNFDREDALIAWATTRKGGRNGLE